MHSENTQTNPAMDKNSDSYPNLPYDLSMGDWVSSGASLSARLENNVGFIVPASGDKKAKAL